MASVFKKKEFDCVGRELFDVLTTLHDLDMWDDLVYEYADKPLELIDIINNRRDEYIQRWEEINRFLIVKLISFAPGTKIKFIRTIRGWPARMGLIDAKHISEDLPRYTPWIYKNMKEIEDSKFISELNENQFSYKIEKVTEENIQRYSLVLGGEGLVTFCEDDFRKEL